MRMVLGLLQKDEGEIWVNGKKVVYGQNKTNRYIGYLPDVPEFYGFLTPMEYLKLCGEVTGMGQKEINARCRELLELVGLKEGDKRIRGFSRGMKQRLGIAQALLNRPKLLICDEPTSALDPVGRKEILDILSSVRRHTTVIFSTHILSDVERICDEVAFLHQGKVVMRGSMGEIKNLRKSTGFEVEFLHPEDLENFSQLFLGGRRIDRLLLRFEKKTEADMMASMQFLSCRNIPIQRLEMLEPSLEDLFLEVVQK